MDIRPRSRQRGAVLLGVIILAALVLIGAATIGVIYLRQLNQQRQVQTRHHLEDAFQGLFPGNLKPRANLNSDFLYSPTTPYPVPPTPSAQGVAPTNFYDLRLLVDRTAVGTSDTAHNPPAQFSGTLTTTTFNAWNGPYWTGPVDGQNRPVDAWGRPLQLRYISTSAPPGWQVFSLGANGVSETGDSPTPLGDDQVFPVSPYEVPVTAAATCPSPQITFYRGTSYNPAEDITLTVTDGAGAIQTTLPLTVNIGGGNKVTFSLAATTPGTISIVAHSSKEGPPHNRGPWGVPAPKTYTLNPPPTCNSFTWDITIP